MIVGTNIGAGVLSIAYASSKAGFLPLLFWLIVVGSLTTITMLYVAESTLRTRKHLQLSGLSQRYVGRFGALMMFLSVCVNSVGALTAYMTGSGKPPAIRYSASRRPWQRAVFLFRRPGCFISA